MQKCKLLWMMGLCWLTLSRLAFAQPLPERRALNGRITDGNGQPLARAAVTLNKEDNNGGFAFWGASTVTDTQGQFSFPDAEEGSYYISAEIAGYDPVQSQRFVLSAESSSWSVALQRLASIDFRFLKPDGSVLSSGPVTIRQDRPDGTSAPLARRTDAAGIVSFKDQKPGNIRLQAVSPGIGYAVLPAVDVSYSDKPHVVDVRLQPGGALSVTAHEAKDGVVGKAIGGAMLSLGVANSVNPADREAGRVTRPKETNIQSLYVPNGGIGGAVTRDGEGKLELRDLPPGRYLARLLTLRYAPPEWQEVEVKVGETATADFLFTPRVPMASLEVTLRDRKEQPVAGEWDLQFQLLSGNIGSEDPAMPPMPPNMEGMGMIPGVSMRRAQSDQNGRFVLYPLLPGKWRLVMSPARDGKPAGERRGNVYQQEVTIPAEGTRITMTVKPPSP